MACFSSLRCGVFVACKMLLCMCVFCADYHALLDLLKSRGDGVLVYLVLPGTTHSVFVMFVRLFRPKVTVVTTAYT